MTTKQNRQDLAELSARLARVLTGSPLWVADAAIELCRIEKAQRLHATRLCNDAWYVESSGVSPADCAAQRITARLKRWQTRYGLESATITREYDPRGAVLKILLPGASEPVSV